MNSSDHTQSSSTESSQESEHITDYDNFILQAGFADIDRDFSDLIMFTIGDPLNWLLADTHPQINYLVTKYGFDRMQKYFTIKKEFLNSKKDSMIPDYSHIPDDELYMVPGLRDFMSKAGLADVHRDYAAHVYIQCLKNNSGTCSQINDLVVKYGYEKICTYFTIRQSFFDKNVSYERDGISLPCLDCSCFNTTKLKSTAHPQFADCWSEIQNSLIAESKSYPK